MPELFTDGAIAEDQGALTDFSSSAGENFGASFQRQWDTNPVAFVGRSVRTFAEDWNARFGNGELVDQETAQTENKRLGLDIDVGAGGMSRYELDTLQYLKQREVGQQTVSARPHGVGATLSGFAGGFAAGALDPINVASAFIPVVQEARYAEWLAAAGESTLARAAVRAKVGAIEGVVGAAAVEPIVYAGAQSEQLDYGVGDSFLNVMFGGILGGGLHVLGGAAYDWRMKRALTQLDVGLRAAYAGVPERTQLAALQQATEALEANAPVRSNEVLATGLKPAEKEALAAVPAKPAPLPATREIPEAKGLSIDVKPVKEGVAITPTGRKVPVLYAVVDLDHLVTSHTKNLDENPAFPQELQPRDRARAQSEAQISNMAARLNPELLGEEPGAGSGAPIVDKAGLVESGNGRIIALQRIAEGNPEKWREYQEFLQSKGYDTEGIAKPVLVRVRTGELTPDERVAFTREANAPTVAGLSASEQARADAKALPDDILELHQGGDFRNVGNGRFVSAAISAIAPSQGERGAFFRPDGSLSDEGARRLERALLARAFGDDAALITALTEASEESGIKAIGNALVDVAPVWSRMRADAAADRIDPAVDSTANLLEAVRTIREARAGGRNLLDVVNQVDLLSGDMDPKTVTWVRAMFRNANLTGPLGRDKVADLLAFYAAEARKQTSGPNLLGEKGATPEQILAARREQDRRRGKQLELLGGQPGKREPDGLFDAPARGNVPEPRSGEVGRPVDADREGAARVISPEDEAKLRTLDEEEARLSKDHTNAIAQNDKATKEYDAARDAYSEKPNRRDVRKRYDRAFAAAKEAGDRLAELHREYLTAHLKNQNVRRAILGFEAGKPSQFSADAQARYEKVRSETIEDLENRYEQQRQRREKDTGAREEFQRRMRDAEKTYADTKHSSRPMPQGDDQRWPVDKDGFVLSDAGGPLHFTDQKQAARWILSEGQKKSPDQNFEIHNYPTGDGYAVREHSRTAKAPERVEKEEPLDLSKYHHPVTGKTLEESTEEALARPSTHLIDTPERQALREKVAEELYGDGAAVKDRDATLILGPPAAGKSAIADPIVKKMGALLIDPDEAKKRLPEFDDGMGSNATHLESAAVQEAILATAVNQGDNIVIPMTGKTPGSTEAIVKQLKDAGYKVRVVLMTLPIKTAAKRAAERYAKHGRLVNIPFVLSVGDKPNGTYEALVKSGLADEHMRYDNDVPKGQPPRLVEVKPDARDAASEGRLSGLNDAVTGLYGGAEGRGLGEEGPGAGGEAAPRTEPVTDRWAAEDDEIAAKATEDIKGKEPTVDDVMADAALYDAHLTSMRERGLLTGGDEADLLAAEQAAIDLEHRAAAYEAAGACEMEG